MVDILKDFYPGKKILITGNTGFKGAWLTCWLLDLGAEVYGLSDCVPTNPSMFELLEISSKINHKFIDINDKTLVYNYIHEVKPELIFHLAAQPIVSESYTNPVGTIKTNLMGSIHIMEAVKRANIKCSLVMITSDKCYENVEWTWGYRENDRLGGKDPYSASKAVAEIAIHSYFKSFFKGSDKVFISSVRAGNVIGGGDWAENRIVPDCVKAWSNQKAVELRNPHATRPWQHVLEPLGAYLLVGAMLDKDLTGQSFNFGPSSDQNHTVLELLKEIGKYWSTLLDSDMFLVNEAKAFKEAGLLKLNCDKALHLLSWQAVLKFKETAEFTSKWYYYFYNKKPNSSELYNYSINQIKDYSNKTKQN